MNIPPAPLFDTVRAVRALLRLGRHPLAVRVNVLSLVGCAALGALELAGIHIGSPTAEMLAAQRRNRVHAHTLSDTCHRMVLLGDPAGAVPLCQEAVQLAPYSPEAQMNLGNALLNSGQLSEAILALQAAAQLAPTWDESHLLLADAYQAQGQFDETREQYHQVNDANPKLPKAYCDLGAALQKRGRDAEAIGEYQEALRAEPEYLPAYHRLIPLLMRYDRRTEAAQWRQQRAEILRLADERRKAFVTLNATLRKGGGLWP